MSDQPDPAEVPAPLMAALASSRMLPPLPLSIAAAMPIEGLVTSSSHNGSHIAVSRRISDASESVYTSQSYQKDQTSLHSALQEEPQLGEYSLGDVSADPQSLKFSYSVAEDASSPQLAENYSRKKDTNFVYRDQDRFVPINNVSRVMRKAIPQKGKVSKDAKECMQECVSEFISFLTSEASDRCIDEKRKTITGDDILYALSTLGFDSYVSPLQLYLRKYRDYLKGDKVVLQDEQDTAPNDPMAAEHYHTDAGTGFHELYRFGTGSGSDTQPHLLI